MDSNQSLPQPASLRLVLMEVGRSGTDAASQGPCARLSPGFPERFRPSSYRKDRSAPNARNSRCHNDLESPRASSERLAPSWRCNTATPPAPGLTPVTPVAPASPFPCSEAPAVPSGLQPVRLLRAVNSPAAAGLDASAPPCPRSARNRGDMRKTSSLPAGNQVIHIRRQPPLVLLDLQNVGGFLARNLPGNPLLATHGVSGYDAARHQQRFELIRY